MSKSFQRVCEFRRGDQNAFVVLRSREVVQSLFEVLDFLLAFCIDVELCLVGCHQMSGIGGAAGGVAAAGPPLSPLIS